MANSYKTLSSEEIFRGKFITLINEQVEIPGGTKTSRQIVSHPGAVVILPVDEDGNFLLLKQYRHALKETIFEFPAGTLEKDEDPLVCAKREIMEETGFSAANWQALGQLYPAPGFCNEIQHSFFATELTPAQADSDEDEIIEVCKMAFPEVKEAIVSNKIRDGKSLAILYQATLKGLI